MASTVDLDTDRKIMYRQSLDKEVTQRNVNFGRASGKLECIATTDYWHATPRLHVGLLKF